MSARDPTKQVDAAHRTYNIPVYGIERENLTASIKEIADRNYKLTFEPFNTKRGFNEFQGVILLRNFSFCEVAAMVAGLIRHDTEMRVEKNCVDSHG